MYRTPAVLALLLMVAACGPPSTEPGERAAAPASLDTDAATETDTTTTGTDTATTTTEPVGDDTTSRGGGTIGSGT